MLSLLILMAFASMVDYTKGQYPLWGWACAYAVIYIIVGFLFGVENIVALLVSAIIIGGYAWGYFKVLEYFKGQTILWLIVYAVGALLPVLVGL